MKHVAVVGAGISGLAAAYFLSRKHRVTLFERSDRLGGHTHTVVIGSDNGPVGLDMGFLVHNERAYPNLVRLFQEIGVETAPSDMSFSVCCAATGIEYSSRGLRGFFAQPGSVTQPSQYRLLRDIMRFTRRASREVSAEGAEAWTLGDYVETHGYGDEFVARFLAPMTSAVWSASLTSVRQFPARALVRFMEHHGMLSVFSHPAWRTVVGGSHTYIPKLTAPLGEAVHTGAHLLAARRSDAGVTLTFANRPAMTVDDVVFACHGDQVLSLLADPSDAERDVFRDFTTTANDVWLHTDARTLPLSARARASWNYRLGPSPDVSPSVTYHLNRLQGISGPTDYCVTLNPIETIAPQHVIDRVAFRHPLMTRASLAARGRWGDVSGVSRTHYCGAYWGHGFHEDGLKSAMRVAHALGAPW